MLLETQRCRLTRFRASDIENTLPLLTNADVRRYLGGALSEDEARKRLESWANGDDIRYTIRLTDGEFLGVVTITPHHDTDNTEVSYMLMPEHWGKGYATETVTAIVYYCRDTLGLKQIVSETQSANERSCRLLERLGFTLCGEAMRFGAKQCIYKLSLK